MPNDGAQYDFGNFEDLFGALFGGGKLTSDVTLLLELTLLEAAHGTERRIELDRRTECSECLGGGGAPGASYHTCSDCQGRGRTKLGTESFFTLTCTTCQGLGGAWSTPCPRCQGHRHRGEPKALMVTVEPGVEDGHKLRLAGQGNRTSKGTGDLFLEIRIAPHPSLWRNGADLHARLALDEKIAEHGGEVKIPWLEGEARVRVPAGATRGDRIVVPGWGAVRFGSPYVPPPPQDRAPYRDAVTPDRGDLIITLGDEPAPPEQPQKPADPGDRRFKWAVIAAGVGIVATAIYTVLTQ